MDKLGKIASIIKDHVEGLSTGESSEGLLNAPGVFLFGLAFPSIDRDTSSSDAGDEIRDRQIKR
jgi:hypothetical protein